MDINFKRMRKTKIKTFPRFITHSFCNHLYRNHLKGIDTWISLSMRNTFFSLCVNPSSVVINRKSWFISRSPSVFVHATRENLIRMFSNNRKCVWINGMRNFCNLRENYYNRFRHFTSLRRGKGEISTLGDRHVLNDVG